MSKWESVKLDDIAVVMLSNVDKKTNDGERIVKLCNYTDVYKNSYISFDKTESFMIASCNENEFNKFELKRDQVAITKDSEKRDDIGISTYIAEDLENVVLGYHTALITPIENKLSGKFLNYWLNTKLAKDYFENNAGGSGQRCTLPIDIIRAIPILLPKYDEQLHISSILFNLDTKIELNNRINAELELMAKTIYDYWFVQFDFPISAEYAASVGQLELEGKPYKSSGGRMVWSDELKREVPEGWELKSLGEYLDCNKNTIKRLDKLEYINYLDTSNLTENKIDFIQRFDIQDDKIPSRAQRYVKTNDILFSTVRPNQHHFGIIKNPKHNLVASTGFAVLTHKSDPTLNDMFYMAITNKTSLKKLESIANSSVSAYPSINYSDILNLRIAFPKNKDLIHLVSSYLSNLFLQISKKQSENETLISLRDWLLPMLMNGQVKVGDVEEEMMGMAAEPLGEYKVNKK